MAGITTGAGVYPISVMALIYRRMCNIIVNIKTRDKAYILVVHYNESVNDKVRVILNKQKYIKIKDCEKQQCGECLWK